MHHLPMFTSRRLIAFALTCSLTSSLVACSPKAVRGDDVAGLDTEAMGTGLDRRDLEKLLAENMNAMDGSPVVRRWEKEEMPRVSVLPFRNDTSEHIDSALDALISKVETHLINAGHVSVISLETQAALMAEVKNNRAKASTKGKPQPSVVNSVFSTS